MHAGKNMGIMTSQKKPTAERGGKGGTRAWRSISKASRLCSIYRHPKSCGRRLLQSLRAAHLWQQQGQGEETSDILAPVYHWLVVFQTWI